MYSELTEIIELQKKHVYRLWKVFIKYVERNETKKADEILSKYYIDAQHILFMMENLKKEIGNGKLAVEE